MEVATRNYALSCIRCEVVIAQERPTSLKRGSLRGQYRAGNTPPPPPFSRPGEVAEEGKEEVEPCVT
jgi:hypothetical protein